ncbi:PAS domain S-box protein [Arcicella aquatica]|uniref:PAS domain S-box protein n=1 Tax=Arcicella aquatica TaxID=217141 RepID=A0ABU5QTP6_9BACT|nr:PAS domain S-box protein [Arcicella aquatica]MEA5260487.1 PAS domain S-box protein [Arcicella aquatica]
MSHILDNMPVSIFVVDIQQQRNVFTNQQYHKVLGYDFAEELDTLGEDCIFRIAPPEDIENLYKFLDILATSVEDKYHNLIARCYCKNGSFKWFKCYITTLEREESGFPKLVLGLAHEITAQMDAREEHLEHIRSIEKVSFLLSHELRHEHSKILSVIDFSKETDMIEVLDLQWLANNIYNSAESIDLSIRSISQQLNAIKEGFVSLNTAEL